MAFELIPSRKLLCPQLPNPQAQKPCKNPQLGLEFRVWGLGFTKAPDSNSKQLLVALGPNPNLAFNRHRSTHWKSRAVNVKRTGTYPKPRMPSLRL